MRTGNSAVRRAGSAEPDAARAVDELAKGLEAATLNSMLFFCSATYDLDALGRSVAERFDCPVLGCTTAGEILSPNGYMNQSLVGVGFTGSDIRFTPHGIPSLADFVKTPDGAPLPAESADASFALLLIDGLSMLEERTASALRQQLPNVPLIGGSAGDDLQFKQTHVYYNGRFHRGAAVLALFQTTLPFRPLHCHHIEPTNIKLVITKADVKKRTVSEINGFPAAQEYARCVGVAPEELTPSIFAAHSVMLRIGGQFYVRSIQKANADGSLTFYCAIDNGLVLTLGRSARLADHLRGALLQLTDELPDMQLLIGFDCILRRIEIEQEKIAEEMRDILASYPYIGFSTYGEQYGGLHVNQTLTGLALGSAHDG